MKNVGFSVQEVAQRLPRRKEVVVTIPKCIIQVKFVGLTYGRITRIWLVLTSTLCVILSPPVPQEGAFLTLTV